MILKNEIANLRDNNHKILSFIFKISVINSIILVGDLNEETQHLYNWWGS